MNQKGIMYQKENVQFLKEYLLNNCEELGDAFRRAKDSLHEGEIKLLKEVIEKSENPKNLVRLREKVGAMQVALASKDKAYAELTGASSARCLSQRVAIQLRALEWTADAMLAALNRARAQSAEFAAERDAAVEKAKTLEAALSEAERELKTLRMQAADAKKVPQKK